MTYNVFGGTLNLIQFEFDAVFFGRLLLNPVDQMCCAISIWCHVQMMT